MFWNEQARRWERHPDCRCGQVDGQPCYCAWLAPLDANGKPIRGSLSEAMDTRLRPPVKKRGAA